MLRISTKRGQPLTQQHQQSEENTNNSGRGFCAKLTQHETFKRRIPAIFNAVICAARKLVENKIKIQTCRRDVGNTTMDTYRAGHFRPLVTNRGLQFNNGVIFFFGPWSFADTRAQMVVPALTALFGHSAGRDERGVNAHSGGDNLGTHTHTHRGAHLPFSRNAIFLQLRAPSAWTNVASSSSSSGVHGPLVLPDVALASYSS
jgi:hypothetical protein